MTDTSAQLEFTSWGQQVLLQTPVDLIAHLENVFVDLLLAPRTGASAPSLVIDVRHAADRIEVDVRQGHAVSVGTASVIDVGAAAAHIVRVLHTEARLGGQLTLLHAGGIVGPRGAVLLPGRSGAGKSTLVAACVRDGAGVLSDELVGIIDDGRVTAAGLPLNLKRSSVDQLSWLPHPGPVAASTIRVNSSVRSAAVAAVVCLTARPGAGLQPVSRRDVLLAMSQLTVPSATDPDRGLARLRRALPATVGVMGRGALHETVAIVMALAGFSTSATRQEGSALPVQHALRDVVSRT